MSANAVSNVAAIESWMIELSEWRLLLVERFSPAAARLASSTVKRLPAWVRGLAVCVEFTSWLVVWFCWVLLLIIGYQQRTVSGVKTSSETCHLHSH